MSLEAADGSSGAAPGWWSWRGLMTGEWRRFAFAAVLALAAAVAFLIWTAFRVGGDRSTIAVDDIGEGVASAVAAISLAVAARRSSGRLRIAWALIAAGAASWTIGEAIWSWYEVFQGIAVPFPSAADAGFLLAIPLGIAGVLTITVLLIAVRRSTKAQVGRILLLVGGLASIAVADSAFTYLTANGTYGK